MTRRFAALWLQMIIPIRYRMSSGTALQPWIAYALVGSIKKGRDLVKTGGMRVINGQIVPGKIAACTASHGEDLVSVPPDVPPLAGRFTTVAEVLHR